jgi:molecular chaperone GrpE (heat shock protein)
VKIMAKGKKKKAPADDAIVVEAEAEDTIAVQTEESEDQEVAKAEESSGTDEDTGEETVEEKPLSLEEQLELARQEAADNKEGWQRAAAELANFKRRKEEQLKLQRDTIKGEVLEGVISALDDIDLAFQNVPEEVSGQVVGWVEGFRLVQRRYWMIKM